MLPVGSLKPNDFGLFDMYGNAQEWCQEPAFFYKAGLDKEDANVQVANDQSRVLRGGSFDFQASLVRSAGRLNDVPAYRSNDNGFRPARTFTP